MVSKLLAEKYAKEIRKKGRRNAKVVKSKVGPNTYTWMIETTLKKNK